MAKFGVTMRYTSDFVLSETCAGVLNVSYKRRTLDALSVYGIVLERAQGVAECDRFWCVELIDGHCLEDQVRVGLRSDSFGIKTHR